MRSAIGKTIRFIGKALYWICGVIGFVISLSIIERATGFWGFLVAFMLAPVAFIAAPWYALVHLGNPFPLVFNYGGVFLSLLLQWLGEKIRPQDL
jgi:hypothetical protein